MSLIKELTCPLNKQLIISINNKLYNLFSLLSTSCPKQTSTSNTISFSKTIINSRCN